MNRLIVAFMTFLIVACAGEPSKPQPAAANAAPPVAAPAASAGGVDAGTSAATATVVFYRPWKFVGGGIGFIVREGTTELGKLRSGKFFVLHVSPGKHTYVVHSEASDELTIDADAGETYYIEGEIGVGVLVGHPHIKPSDQASFEAVKTKLQEVAPIST